MTDEQTTIWQCSYFVGNYAAEFVTLAETVADYADTWHVGIADDVAAVVAAVASVLAFVVGTSAGLVAADNTVGETAAWVAKTDAGTPVDRLAASLHLQRMDILVAPDFGRL